MPHEGNYHVVTMRHLIDARRSLSDPRTLTSDVASFERMLDRSDDCPYHAFVMEPQAAAQLNPLVDQPSRYWFYFYFTPPALLVGLSGLSR